MVWAGTPKCQLVTLGIYLQMLPAFFLFSYERDSRLRCIEMSSVLFGSSSAEKRNCSEFLASALPVQGQDCESKKCTHTLSISPMSIIPKISEKKFKSEPCI